MSTNNYKTSDEEQFANEPSKVDIKSQVEKKPEVWNSLERAKIFVGLLTPIVIVIITLSINYNINESNKNEEHNKRIFQERQNIYTKIGPLLNDIYCYIMFVGHWKQLSPFDIIERKRELDKTIYISTPYFDSASVFLKYYNNFIDAAFKAGQGWGKDAMLRSNSKLHETAIDTAVLKWNQKWDSFFTGEDNREQVRDSYFALLRQVSTELDLEVKGEHIDKTIEIKPPFNP